MRALLIFCFAWYSTATLSQIRWYSREQKSFFLVAKNAKHEHWYREGKALEISYIDSSGTVVKATGRLYINDSVNIKLQRHNGRVTFIINPANIVSIKKWTKPSWVVAGIAAGVGLAIGIPTFSALNNGSGNFGLLFPAIIAVFDGYFIIADIPIIIISEALSIRSQKKEYHYFIGQD